MLDGLSAAADLHDQRDAPPAGTTGTIPALNKQGVVADVVGTGALIHTQQTTANLKARLRSSARGPRRHIRLGIWNNVQTSNPQTYLTSTATGAPTFGGVSSFASNEYTWNQTHMSNAVSLKSDTPRHVRFRSFGIELQLSAGHRTQSLHRHAGRASAISQNGKITRNDGTNWQNADAKGIWRPYGFDGPHEISFGIHGDRYYFDNPVYASSIWNATPSTGTGQLYSDGIGETRTGALWAQDAWKIVPTVKLTLGGRLETWRALDGFNVNTAATAAGVITSTRGRQSARTELDQFLAEGVAVLRSEQGLEHHREFRRGLSLSDRHRALPEHNRQRRGDLRQSEPDARSRISMAS